MLAEFAREAPEIALDALNEGKSVAIFAPGDSFRAIVSAVHACARGLGIEPGTPNKGIYRYEWNDVTVFVCDMDCEEEWVGAGDLARTMRGADVAIICDPSGGPSVAARAMDFELGAAVVYFR